MTLDRYGRTTQRTNGAFTHRVSSTGDPQSDGVLNKSVRIKVRIKIGDFTRLFFLDDHREYSILTGKLHEEPKLFRFLRAG
jgi:hypothetical protein